MKETAEVLSWGHKWSGWVAALNFAHCQAHLGHPVTDAVITVPAYFNDSQRSEYLETGDLESGQIVPRLVAVSSSLWLMPASHVLVSSTLTLAWRPRNPETAYATEWQLPKRSRMIVTSDISQVFKMNFRINIICMYYILQIHILYIYTWLYVYITHQLLITNEGNNSRWMKTHWKPGKPPRMLVPSVASTFWGAKIWWVLESLSFPMYIHLITMKHMSHTYESYE